YYEACLATIGTDDEADEFAAGGFTQEQAKTIAAPRIAEAFLSVECKLEKVVEYGEGGTLIVGKVINVSVAEEFADGVDGKYGDDGYMVYMSPKSLKTGAGKYAAATCKVFRVDEG
ncbi:MAG: flavin reductase, partial [Defluviitaleaceae bacterium]|nr:flavin reductase [Defluviitaleaceae bacterium]